MVYTFGSAGGNKIQTGTGKEVTCTFHDGVKAQPKRAAVTTIHGWAVCMQCEQTFNAFHNRIDPKSTQFGTANAMYTMFTNQANNTYWGGGH